MDGKKERENDGKIPEDREHDERTRNFFGVETEEAEESKEGIETIEAENVDEVFTELDDNLEELDETIDQASETVEEPIREERVTWEEPEAKKPRRKGLRGIALFLVFVLIFSTGYGLGSGIAGLRAPRTQIPYEVPNHASETNTSVVVNREPNLIVDLVDRVGPSIVAIQTEVVGTDVFGNAQLGQSAGSGVVFDRRSEELLLLTNQHVIDGARAIQVTFEDGVTVAAELLGADSETDLAVLKLSRDDFDDPANFDRVQSVPFGDSSKVRTGEVAIAIGNPLGLGNSVTQGIISSQQREISTNGRQSVSLIQTDAAINPGNSGGALLNDRGELIGINTIKIADEKVEGIGFAIPINHAIPILEQLVETGEVVRPYIGIIGEALGAERARSWGVPEGVLLVRVLVGTPAREAGLKAGDIITEFDGNRITTMEALLGQLYFKKVGESIEVKGYRDDVEFSVTLKLAQRADE
jgi:serine protease Do